MAGSLTLRASPVVKTSAHGLVVFSELYCIAALIPNCLRLAIYVTTYHPRLATNG